MKKIFTNGCFDILHRGHFELLKFCKSLGHVVLGLNSNTSVKKLKGSSRPFFDELDRKFALESCKYVDEVHIFTEETPYELIKKIEPSIIVKGRDYKVNDVVGNDIAEVVLFNYIDGYSTTKTLRKISHEIK